MHSRKDTITFWIVVAGLSWALKLYPHWDGGLVIVLAIGLVVSLIAGRCISRYFDEHVPYGNGKWSDGTFMLLFFGSAIGMLYLSAELGLGAGLGWAFYFGACLPLSLLISYWVEGIVQEERRIMNPARYGATSVSATITQTSVIHTAQAPLTDKTLDDLVGLEEVKREVSRTLAVAKMQTARKKKCLKTVPYSFHAVLTGNPGTGKTTFARVYGKILRDAGILKKGHFVEADRSDLTGEFLGQTAPKVKAKVREAIGGVLFIDEAYALAPTGYGDSYASEAINTLVPLIEEHRDELVVLLAGYEDEMRGFIDSNPGLKSRFRTFLNFPDYVPDELMQIFEGICQSNDYSLDEDARRAAINVFNTAYAKRGRDFGNGRLARNLFETAVAEQALRLDGKKPTKAALSLLTGTDIEGASPIAS